MCIRDSNSTHPRIDNARRKTPEHCPGCSIFQRLLAATPSDPRGNYMYGTLLAGVGKPKEALPYLEKALAVGVADAAYAIGIAYLTLGDKERALRNLEDYKARNPGDTSVDKLMDAIRNGKVEFKRSPG